MMKTQRSNRASRVVALFLSFMMTLVFIPTFSFASYAAEGDSITVFLTVSDQGELATDNNGEAMAWRDVTVTDLDGDGHYTFDEVLVAAHEMYNSADGYMQSNGAVKKLWGTETSNTLFFINHEGLGTGVTADTVEDGDYCVASVNADNKYWADWYTFFDLPNDTVSVDEEITLNLSGHLGMAYTDEEKVNVPIAGATVSDTQGNEYGTTDENGNITLSFDKPGMYIVTAAGTTEDVVTDWNLMNYKTMDSTVDGTAFVKFDWETYDSFVAYTKEDHGDGPYPVSEIEYIDFMEEAGEDSENDYAWEDLNYLTSNQVITDCPTIAPACAVTVEASPIDYEGSEVMFVQEDLTSTFGMLTPKPSPAPSYKLSDDESKVIFSFEPGNLTVYAGFYIEATTVLPQTWDEGKFIEVNSDGTYSFELDASYCGKAWPVAPVKKKDMSATTGKQYYLAIPAKEQFTTSADYTKGDEALTKASGLDENLYTEEGLQAIEDAVAAVDRSKNKVEQSVVDAMAQAIEDAIQDGKKPADYSAVEAAKAKVPADLSIYTDETKKAVEDAVAAVEEGKKIDEQAAVDAMAAAIEEAVDKLEMKPADYSAVDAAIAKVPKDMSKYTDASVKAVNDAVKAVVRGKMANEQAAVDNMAKAINNAVAGLKAKEVKKGWKKENGSWYYYNNDGTAAKNTWKKDSKGWCYLGSDGKMVANGWAKDSKGTVWMNGSGYWDTSTKWIKSGGNWYHITKGYMDTSKWMKDSKGWCYLGKDGKMVTNGWAKDSHGWCWMGSNGYWTSNKWVKDKGEWYYIKSNHYMASNEWAKDSKGWMFMAKNGKITKSKWVKSGGVWYYLKDNGYMATGTQKIGGKTYRFNSAGKWIQ